MTDKVKSNVEVFNEWAKFVDYDEDQVEFNFGSLSYIGNRSADAVKFLNKWDPSGDFSIVCIKQRYDNWLDSTSVKCSELVDPEKFEDWSRYVEMHKTLDESCDAVFDKFKEIVTSAINKSLVDGHLIGDIDIDKTVIAEAMNEVSEDIDRLGSSIHLTVYKSSGEPLGALTSINSKIAVFSNIAECLVTLESMDDGCYLCYVRTQMSADGWFGYFVKSNGNLISVDDRIDEVYPGQHHNSRNGRYLEDKAYGWFPYCEGLFDFKDYDYKGYARTFDLQEHKLDLAVLPDKVFVKTVLAMWLISSRYSSMTFDKSQEVIVNAFRCGSLDAVVNDAAALMKISDSELAVVNKRWTSPITVDQIVIGDTSFAPEVHYVRTNDLVMYHSDGFDVSKDSLSNLTLDVFSDETIDDPAFDIVATPEKIASMEYYRGRKLLADYIRNNVVKKFNEFGGIEAMHEWYGKLIDENIDQLEEMCAMSYANLKVTGDVESYGSSHRVNGWTIDVRIDQPYHIDFVRPKIETVTRQINLQPARVFDRFYDDYDHRVIVKDRINGCSCNVWFKLLPKDWKTIENTFDTKVPDCMKGWYDSYVYDETRYAGNPLLDIVDAVANMKHPMDVREHSYNHKEERDDCQVDFKIAIGMSKRRVKSMARRLSMIENSGGDGDIA